MNEKLDKFLEDNGMKEQADANKVKAEATKKKYKDKEKDKKLTLTERIDRLEETICQKESYQ